MPEAKPDPAFIVVRSDKDSDEYRIEGETVQWGEDAPESTLYTRIDDLLWSDCDSCRAIRLGLAIGSLVYPTLILVGVLIFA